GDATRSATGRNERGTAVAYPGLIDPGAGPRADVPTGRYQTRVARVGFVREDAMSLQISAKAPFRMFPTGVDESRPPGLPARGRSEASDQSVFVLACRDVIDEVCLRMAVRGYQWE